jgi:hypothetical protein
MKENPPRCDPARVSASGADQVRPVGRDGDQPALSASSRPQDPSMRDRIDVWVNEGGAGG